jgi:FkbM family methyltransferase
MLGGEIRARVPMAETLIGFLIALYRRTPLYPRWGKNLAGVLASYHRWVNRGSPGLVSHQVGDFQMSLDLTQVIDSQLFYSSTFDPESIRVLRSFARAGDTVIDVGANIGWMTLHLARQVGRTGTVLAFEPSPPAAARLRHHVRVNEFSQVQVVELALGERPEGPRPMKIRSAYRVDGVDDTEEAEIATTTLDAFLADHRLDPPSFIKIDTDGREVSVIRGAAKTLAQAHPAVLFELGTDALEEYGATPEALLALLEGLGYRFLRASNFEPYADVRSEAARIPRETTINIIAVPTIGRPA